MDLFMDKMGLPFGKRKKDRSLNGLVEMIFSLNKEMVL